MGIEMPLAESSTVKSAQNGAPMPGKNLFLKLFYRFLQLFVWITLRIYYRAVETINPEHLNTSGRMLIVSNHPNTLIDPLITMGQLYARPSLLAKYTLFKNPLSNIILRTLYCIPIQRSQDVGGHAVDNRSAFDLSTDHLSQGGALYLAPEGLSVNERHIRPIKKGLARIYLQAYEQGLTDVHILIVGLTYFNHQKPNTDVVLHVAAPFQPIVDSALTRTQNLEAITNEVEEKFIQHVIHCTDAEEEKRLYQLESLSQSENYLQVREKYERSKKKLEALRFQKSKIEKSYFEFEQLVKKYFLLLEKNNLRDVNTHTFEFSKKIFFILATLPFSIFGFVNNVVPLQIVNYIKRRFDFDPDYRTTMQYLTGLGIYPLCWWLQFKVWRWFFYFQHDAVVYTACVALGGYVARAQWVNLKKCLNYLRFQNSVAHKDLASLRAKIIETIEKWDKI